MYCSQTGPIGRLVPLGAAVGAKGKGGTIGVGHAGWQVAVLSREREVLHIEQ